MGMVCVFCSAQEAKIIVFPFFSRDIPVDMKYVAEPSMHSMPAVTVHPSGKGPLQTDIHYYLLSYPYLFSPREVASMSVHEQSNHDIWGS